VERNLSITLGRDALLVATIAGLIACARPGELQRAPATVELVWADEFDRDGRPDSAKWTFERGFVRNQELQWYRPENARVENGHLVIEARRERLPNPAFDSTSHDWRLRRPHAEYTSASLTTRGPHNWQYGRFEMRGRIDVRPGLWPAFWTVGDSGRWPASGEIDIMEYYDGVLLANVAWADGSGRPKWDSSRRPVAELGGAAWADDYHVWRMDWDEREIRLYVDDLLLNSTPLDSTFNGAGGPPNPLRQPHHVILNLAIGGTQGGDPSGTQFPARFEVDYVRVYTATPSAPRAWPRR
jgi:beta-glucanase (GH16 family)